ncbi:uncharacterized protein BROUX77_003229 [Berkeleyomyces rouxiae]|uniref:uncharacterized protein n=1 Tax=Berkeleyomyces rouxiae TaxID=2035830 RepID=UPI003B7B752B
MLRPGRELLLTGCASALRLSARTLQSRIMIAAPFRQLSQSPVLQKKDKYAKGGVKRKGGADSSSAGASSSASVGAGAEGHDSEHPAADPQQPRNLADVESRWARTAAHYTDALKQFKSGGGAFDADALGALAVRVGSGKTAATYPLRELAQVVPRTARSVSLLAFEKDYIKPLMSAVQAAPDFNQQPQPDKDNELELVLRIEAVPAEQLTKKLTGLCHAWREQIRAIRTKREKLVQTWAKDKTVLPDVAKAVSADLLKVMQKHIKSVDAAETQATNDIKRRASA